MANCEQKLANNFLTQCGYKPKTGVLAKWFFNIDDIDKTATQLSNQNTVITSLVLKTGAKIYRAEGNDKSHQGSHALSTGDYGNGYIHTDKYTLLYTGATESEQIQNLVSGARMGSIIKLVDGGIAGENSFKILGYESGMTLTEDAYSTAENGGTTGLSLSTKEGEEESTRIKIFLDTDFATTEAWIAANEFTAP